VAALQQELSATQQQLAAANSTNDQHEALQADLLHQLDASAAEHRSKDEAAQAALAAALAGQQTLNTEVAQLLRAQQVAQSAMQALQRERVQVEADAQANLAAALHKQRRMEKQLQRFEKSLTLQAACVEAEVGELKRAAAEELAALEARMKAVEAEHNARESALHAELAALRATAASAAKAPATMTDAAAGSDTALPTSRHEQVQTDAVSRAHAAAGPDAAAEANEGATQAALVAALAEKQGLQQEVCQLTAALAEKQGLQQEVCQLTAALALQSSALKDRVADPEGAAASQARTHSTLRGLLRDATAPWSASKHRVCVLQQAAAHTSAQPEAAVAARGSNAGRLADVAAAVADTGLALAKPAPLVVGAGVGPDRVMPTMAAAAVQTAAVSTADAAAGPDALLPAKAHAAAQAQTQGDGTAHAATETDATSPVHAAAVPDAVLPTTAEAEVQTGAAGTHHAPNRVCVAMRRASHPGSAPVVAMATTSAPAAAGRSSSLDVLQRRHSRPLSAGHITSRADSDSIWGSWASAGSLGASLSNSLSSGAGLGVARFASDSSGMSSLGGLSRCYSVAELLGGLQLAPTVQPLGSSAAVPVGTPAAAAGCCSAAVTPRKVRASRAKAAASTGPTVRRGTKSRKALEGELAAKPTPQTTHTAGKVGAYCAGAAHSSAVGSQPAGSAGGAVTRAASAGGTSTIRGGSSGARAAPSTTAAAVGTAGKIVCGLMAAAQAALVLLPGAAMLVL
jgi:hypothetical protein